MENVKNISISRFANAFNAAPQTSSIYSELLAIKNGDYKQTIMLCRELVLSNKRQEYNNAKKKLPAVTFSGVFSERRVKEALISHSGYMILDFDGVDNVDETKSILTNDKYNVAIWMSPSGQGLKLLVRIASDFSNQKFLFDAISDYYFEQYGLSTDKSGSDITRLCFTSFDPDLYFNNDAETWITQKLPSNEVVRFSTMSKQPGNIRQTEGKNVQADRTLIKKIIKYLSKNKKSITSTYDLWYRVGFAIANSFTPELGVALFLEICRLDGDMHNEESSISLIEYCYRNNKGNIKFATIVHLAISQGFAIK